MFDNKGRALVSTSILLNGMLKGINKENRYGFTI